LRRLPRLRRAGPHLRRRQPGGRFGLALRAHRGPGVAEAGAMKRGLPLAALGLWLFFAVLHFAGLRSCLGALSLAAPPGVPLDVALAGAAAYLLAYFGATVVAPV